MTQPIRLQLEGALSPDQTLTYLHLPFDVPAGIQQLDVRYRYDAQISSDPTLTDGNTIDIGIFDPRGIGFSSEGFRGWTGSARQAFSLGIDHATPGYMPGAIQAGTWHICLGAYKVARQGCRYQVDITLTPSTAPQTTSFPALLALTDRTTAKVSASGWYRGELHCHTVHSDGDSTPEELVRHAEALGLDFLAITDHNNRTQQVDMAVMQSDTPLILIPGYEITTYFGHANVWGDGSWVDFRVQSADDMRKSIAYAHEQAYLVSCNHPKPYGPAWTFTEVEGYDCVEVWNGEWAFLNDIALNFWEERLLKGQRLVAVGGSDHHFSKTTHMARLGHPTNVIFTSEPLSSRSILQAVRAGHNYITDSPQGAQLTLASGSLMMGDTAQRPANGQLPVALHVDGGARSQLQLLAGRDVILRYSIDQAVWTSDELIDVTNAIYIRAQLVDENSQHVKALTNPIYIR